MRWWLSLILVLLAVGTLRVAGCGDECGGCDDGNPCTRDTCDHYTRVIEEGYGCEPDETESGYACNHRRYSDGTPCGDGKVCLDGYCLNSCTVDCDDGNPCTSDQCSDSQECVNDPLPSMTLCYPISDRESVAGLCLDGVCTEPCHEDLGWDPCPVDSLQSHVCCPWAAEELRLYCVLASDCEQWRDESESAVELQP